MNHSTKGVTWTSSNTNIATVDGSGIVTINAGVCGKDTIVVKTVEGNATDTCIVTVLPAGALAGEFTVAEDKKVHFSQSNLRYVVNGTKWEFYENQYGLCNTNTYDGHHADTVSLFTWGYNATKSIVPDGSASGNVSIKSGNLSQKQDWGCKIGDGNTWHTLTTAEWQYLFKSRTNASILYKYAVTVCGKTNCLIIAPDNWDTSANPLQTSYDETTWATAEAAGLVCLPATGYRNGSYVYNVGSGGNYWSSSAKDSNIAYKVLFSISNVNPDSNERRSRAYSVRLITDVK